jgi:hypothetical protein
MLQTKVAEKITHILCLATFPESRDIYKTMWKKDDDIIWRMRFA